jgi:hypothetical protein
MEYAASNGVSSARENGVPLWELSGAVNAENRPSHFAEMPPLLHDEQVSVGDSDSRPSNLTYIFIVPDFKFLLPVDTLVDFRRVLRTFESERQPPCIRRRFSQLSGQRPQCCFLHHYSGHRHLSCCSNGPVSYHSLINSD